MANDQGTFLAYRNYVELASTTLATAATAQGDRIADNLKTRESDDFWRFAVAAMATSATVTATFAADQTIGVVTTQFPRGSYPGVSEDAPVFASTDTIRYRLLDASDVELADSGTNASGVEIGYMTHYWRPNAAVSGVRKIEATYDAISRASAGFCDVGMLGAWPVFEPNVGFSYPGGYGWRLNNETARTMTGRFYGARFEPLRQWSLVFDFLSNTEAMTIDEMIRYSGGARQVFVRRGDLPSGKDAMLAIVNPVRDMESRTATLRQQSLTFDEFI